MTKAKKVVKQKQPQTKLCPKCGRKLTVDKFPHDYRRVDGLYIYCRECEAKRQHDKYTRTVVKDAEENGFVVLTVTNPAPVLDIDVFKIDINPNNGRTIETELAPKI